MGWIKKTYLYHLYCYHKTLFWIVFFFAAGSVLANLSGIQTTPFYVWGMYSEKFPPKNEYSFLVVENEKGETLPLYSRHGYKTRFFLHSPLLYYDKTYHLDGKDPNRAFFQKKLQKAYSLIAPFETHVFSNGFDYFQPWYKKYRHQTDEADFEYLYILNVAVGYNPEGIQQMLRIDTLYVF